MIQAHISFDFKLLFTVSDLLIFSIVKYQAVGINLKHAPVIKNVQATENMESILNSLKYSRMSCDKIIKMKRNNTKPVMIFCLRVSFNSICTDSLYKVALTNSMSIMQYISTRHAKDYNVNKNSPAIVNEFYSLSKYKQCKSLKLKHVGYRMQVMRKTLSTLNFQMISSVNASGTQTVRADISIMTLTLSKVYTV